MGRLRSAIASIFVIFNKIFIKRYYTLLTLKSNTTYFIFPTSLVFLVRGSTNVSCPLTGKLAKLFFEWQLISCTRLYLRTYLYYVRLLLIGAAVSTTAPLTCSLNLITLWSPWRRRRRLGGGHRREADNPPFHLPYLVVYRVAQNRNDDMPWRWRYNTVVIYRGRYIPQCFLTLSE